MTIVKDCFDDPTVALSVSPREIKLILRAMNQFDDLIYKNEIHLSEEMQYRWDEVLDHIKDQALAYGA